MKKLLFTLAFTFVGAMTTATPLAAQPPQGTTVVTFDSFCDGLTINVSGSFVTGTHDNWDCLGAVVATNGSVANVSRLYPAILKPKPLVMLGDAVGLAALGCPINWYLDFSSNKWAFYYSCFGEPEVLGNRGTFSITTPALRGRTGLPSTLRPGKIVDESDAAAAPAGPYLISFNGACDYFLVNTSGTKVGAIHDATGCGAGQFIAAGNNASLSAELTGTAGDGAMLNSSISQIVDPLGCVIDYYFSFSNSTYASYSSCNGGAPQLIGAGPMIVTTPTAKPAIVAGGKPTYKR